MDETAAFAEDKTEILTERNQMGGMNHAEGVLLQQVHHL